MNRLFAALSASVLLAGCNASSNQTATSDADVSTTASTTENAAPQTVASAEPVASAKAPVTLAQKPGTAKKPVTVKNAKTAPANAADSRYLPDQAPIGLPPELTDALRKVKVPAPPASLKVGAKVRVRLVTSKGPITVELDGKEAPLHTKSFVYLSQRGFYNGTVFHRFANLLEGTGQTGNIIQGGDPLSKSPQTSQFAGGGSPGYKVPREYNKLKHAKLVIAAARSQDPDSAGSQFYITQDPVPFLDDPPGYTVFGKVVAGGDNALKLRQDDVLKSAQVLK